MAKKEVSIPSEKEAAKPTPSENESKEEILPDEALDEVSGGTATTPRDAASGLATGKRTHKPYL